MVAPDGQLLLQQAFRVFQDLVESEGVRVTRQSAVAPDSSRDDVWRIETSQRFCELAVQAYRRFTPRHADQVVSGVSRLMRSMRPQPILVVAPWLSPQSRELLVDQEINYLDLTGNVWLRLPNPLIIVRTEGARKDPDPSERPPVRLQGKGINALVRILVDVAPPYRMVDLARATGLSPGYVSRTLEALDEERLIDRGRDRVVHDVDWQRLLRRRAEHYGLLKSNHTRGYLARTGLTAFARDLAVTRPGDIGPDADAEYRRLIGQGEDPALVTGSFAVSDYVRVAAPAQLVLYVPDADQFADRHGLMPVDRGANVLLLRAADRSQLDRVRMVDGVLHVGVSQLALDCLAGNGRLPEEGDALLDWMRENVVAWRKDKLPER
ncbi:hypothetical protein [Micromonospora cathayae]|uniref:Uncharacterized protein n=1 Tax=Micromonospora cathayae TaxID=3028804 RepID=A0ABY7ZRC7_9ACTN|nr:hypothetical protein [Micromonospora sp. HUAS 3]WDZ85582.1 hypothetical protein PVK37_03765 [Micromonospora sp. HUAS 3]